jgi:hypothetical protein
MDAIKKWGHFKAYKEAHEAYVEQRNLVKQAKATLAELGCRNFQEVFQEAQGWRGYGWCIWTQPAS